MKIELLLTREILLVLKRLCLLFVVQVVRDGFTYVGATLSVVGRAKRFVVSVSRFRSGFVNQVVCFTYLIITTPDTTPNLSVVIDPRASKIALLLAC